MIKTKKAKRFNLGAAFKKARAAMRDPQRKACKHGHPITAKNANEADLQRLGKYYCKPCIKMYAGQQRAKSQGTDARKLTMPVPTDPDTLLKESFRFVASRYANVPEGERMNWMQNLSGMLLSNLGAKQARRIAPVKVPKGFGIVGRPAAA